MAGLSTNSFDSISSICHECISNENRNKCNNLVKNNNTKQKQALTHKDIHTRTYIHTTLRWMDAWETDDTYLLVEK